MQEGPKTNKGERGPDMSRRKFLRGLGAGAAAVAVDALDPLGKYKALAGFVAQSRESDQYDYDQVVKEAKAYLRETYNIHLVMGADKDPNTAEILGEKVALDNYKQTVRLIVEEIQRYPARMIKNVMMNGRPLEIRVVQVLNLKKASFTGLTRAAGVAFHSGGNLFGKAERIGLDATEDRNYQRQSIHHELNHMFIAGGGRLHQQRRWIAMHAKLTKTPYVNVLEDFGVQKSPQASVNTSHVAFLDYYARLSSGEDEAVCAEYMFMPRLHVAFREKIRSERDPLVKEVLLAKYNAVKADYRLWSNGEMGDAFWDEIYQKGLSEKESIKTVTR
ncbi:hypothetical protein HY970_02490 [Candidatus Kaiserbacteria bacterium]|nr:hypothetical protein [Candidatus Kaiserbacteria bacterium]